MTANSNLAIARRYADAWLAGDMATLLDCYHDDFTLHYFGANPLSGEHRGKAAAMAVLGEVSRRTGRRLLAIQDVMAGETRAAILAREAWTRDGQRVELDRLLLYSLQDGRLRDCWIYDADQALVDRFLADSA